MKSSLIYRHSLIYKALMLMLYGRHYWSRNRALAALIPAGATVLDLCCGPPVLYEGYLKEKSVAYTGYDLNPGFVRLVIQAGGQGLVCNLHEEAPLPAADIVMMQGSLFHFLPDVQPILARMLTAARQKIIIAEPIRNLSDSRWSWLAALARRHTDPGGGAQPERFNEETLAEAIAPHRDMVERSFLIDGGRERVLVLTPQQHGAHNG